MAQSGGYLPITNLQNSTFGLYALRAFGFRAQAFEFICDLYSPMEQVVQIKTPELVTEKNNR